MKKILFILAVICIFSCEPIDNDVDCKICTIKVYSLSGSIEPRVQTKELCTPAQFDRYPEGKSKSTACKDCLMVVKCK